MNNIWRDILKFRTLMAVYKNEKYMLEKIMKTLKVELANKNERPRRLKYNLRDMS